MKNLKHLFVLFLISFLLINCKENNTSKNVAATKDSVVSTENIEEVNFSVKGMTCAMGCAKMIEEDLSAIEGVKDAKVDFDKETATIHFDKTKQNPEKLKKVIESAGDGKTYIATKI